MCKLPETSIYSMEDTLKLRFMWALCAPLQNIWKPLDISLITIVIVQQPQRWPRNCEALEAAKGNRKCNGPMHLLQHHLKTEADKWCFWATAHSGQRASVTLNENHFVCIEKLKPCYTMFNCMYVSKWYFS